MIDYRSLFLLDPTVVFLNHGSFGACPRPVFETYQNWQRELERQPVEFLGRRATGLLAEARAALAHYVGCETDELIYTPNPTFAVNIVARSIKLNAGDEVLTTDHEYGAMDRTWRFLTKQVGAHYIQRPVALPVTTREAFIENFWAGVTPRTRVIFLSHITSTTALIFPIEEICRRARAAGILTIIDGAHAPSQFPLNIRALECDFYTGANHKWLCAPKGSAFLYVRPEHQAWINPLVVSWGWGDDLIAPRMETGATEFIRFHEWQGTRDIAPFLATPEAIRFQATHDWDTVRMNCHALAVETRQRVNAFTGLDSICPDDWLGQFTAIRLPDVDLVALKTRLYDEYRVEAPMTQYGSQNFIRVAFQAYNSRTDADALVHALKQLL